MHANNDFPVANPQDDQPYTLDFINDLTPGDYVVGAVVTLTVQTGTDPDPSSHVIGSEFITGTTFVSQRIRGLLAGNIYSLNIVAITNQGFNVMLYALIPCEDVFS